MATTIGGAKTYDLKSVDFAVNGTPVSGFGDGDVCSISYESEEYTGTSGADGEYMFSKTNNRSGTIAFTLLYSSLANKTFSDLVALGNDGLTSISIRDTRGGSKVFARGCYVEKIPDLTFGREGGTLEWSFRCAEIKTTFSGLKDETPTV